MLAQQALCLLSCLPVPSLQLHQSHESLCSNGQRLSGHRVSQASSRRTSIYTSRLYTAAGVISEGFFLSLFSPWKQILRQGLCARDLFRKAPSQDNERNGGKRECRKKCDVGQAPASAPWSELYQVSHTSKLPSIRRFSVLPLLTVRNHSHRKGESQTQHNHASAESSGSQGWPNSHKVKPLKARGSAGSNPQCQKEKKTIKEKAELCL